MAGARTFLLVHGAYHGGWCWGPVAERLRAAGHAVHAPTLPGLGERASLAATRPTLATFLAEVGDLVLGRDLRDVVLVGHSFAGSVVSGLADRMPERLAHLVYLDALVLEDGEAPFDGLPAEVVARHRAVAQATSGGLTVPPPEPEYFGITDPAQAEWLRARLTPQPFDTYTSRLALEAPPGNGRPATYVAATAPPFPATARSRERARRMRGWAYREIATGHDAMLTDPDGTAALLAGAG